MTETEERGNKGLKIIYDNPSYDPLWTENSAEKYLYVPPHFADRDNLVPTMVESKNDD